MTFHGINAAGVSRAVTAAGRHRPRLVREGRHAASVFSSPETLDEISTAQESTFSRGLGHLDLLPARIC